MAHHKATIKNIIRIKERTERNAQRKSRVRTAIRKVTEAVAAKDAEAANVALRNAQKELMRAASKGVIKASTASRKLSRLNAGVKALATAK